MISAIIITPPEYLGFIFKLCDERRGAQTKLSYLSKTRVLLEYELPLGEVVLDFFDRLKSVSRGFASFDYSFERFQAAPLVKLDVMINGERIPSAEAEVRSIQLDLIPSDMIQTVEVSKAITPDMDADAILMANAGPPLPL